MEAVILVIHLIVALGIIAVVLIQPSEAGGFLGTGSMSNMMAPRRSADVLTRITTILAGCFFLTSLSLAIMAENRGPSKSILDQGSQPATEKIAPEPDSSVLKTVPPAPVEEKTKGEERSKAAPTKGKPSAPISK